LQQLGASDVDVSIGGNVLRLSAASANPLHQKALALGLVRVVLIPAAGTHSRTASTMCTVIFKASRLSLQKS
jgi:hypothetical protein